LEQLLSVEKAKEILLQKFLQKEATLIPISSAMGRILSEDINASINLPPFNNSSMDGFAVIAEDVINATQDKPVSLNILEDIAAGFSPKHALSRGQSSRIMTGAPLPDGADAVVPVEFTNFSDRYAQKALPDEILVYKPVKMGDYLRPEGQDILKGEKIFSKGHKLRPQDLGFLSAQGIAEVSVVSQPKIALLSSGDELINPGEKLIPGKIYNSNTITIKTLLESFGAQVFDLGVAKDDFEDVKAKFQSIENLDVDLFVSTAGVSVGVYDFIRDVILEQGTLNFWKVNMRPGKPLTFGEYKNIPFIGLPGNPVSAYVSTIVFIKHVINKLLGNDEETQYFSAVLDENIESDGRESYLRIVASNEAGNYHAKLAQHQGSGNIFSLVCANALLIIPAGVKSLPKGKSVKFFWI
jgi:molybdopterin molybdotransferase